jgi:hypothetical protein
MALINADCLQQQVARLVFFARTICGNRIPDERVCIRGHLVPTPATSNAVFIIACIGQIHSISDWFGYFLGNPL